LFVDILNDVLRNLRSGDANGAKTNMGNLIPLIRTDVLPYMSYKKCLTAPRTQSCFDVNSLDSFLCKLRAAIPEILSLTGPDGLSIAAQTVLAQNIPVLDWLITTIPETFAVKADLKSTYPGMRAQEIAVQEKLQISIVVLGNRLPGIFDDASIDVSPYHLDLSKVKLAKVAPNNEIIAYKKGLALIAEEEEEKATLSEKRRQAKAKKSRRVAKKRAKQGLRCCQKWQSLVCALLSKKVDERTVVTKRELHAPASVEELEPYLCVICVDSLRDTVLMPCLHLVSCAACADKLDNTCPLCRAKINAKISVYY